MAEDSNDTPLHTKVGEWFNELFKPVSAILIIFSFIVYMFYASFNGVIFEGLIKEPLEQSEHFDKVLPIFTGIVGTVIGYLYNEKRKNK